MTNFFVSTYLYFRKHRAVFWSTMAALFVFLGYFSTQIHLEEDLNKLMPASQNEDGSTKLAFANLRIKDKTFLLFEGNGETSTERLAEVCDAFVDSLLAKDSQRDSTEHFVSDVFCRLDDDLMPDGIGYLSEHLPAYIDTTVYARIDSLLTPEHIAPQMEQNKQDLTGEFGEAFPELILM